MNHLRVVAVLVLAFVVGSCQTITEDLPATSYGNLPSAAPVPIVVIQIPLPAPASSLPTSPTQPPPTSGGGGGGTQPSAPTSAPQNQQPDNGCWRNNCNPVASIHAQIFHIVCNGVSIGGKDATEVPADCDAILDATPKDASGRATQSDIPSWNVSGGRTVVNANTFTPKIIGGGRGGDVTFTASVGNVTSNAYTFTFR